jgi:hypothetical protein
MNKSGIIANLNTAHSVFWETAIQLPNPTISTNEKWSVCQNVQHITIALSRVSNYLALPKSSIKSDYGLSDRASSNYEISFNLFKNTLENGVKTTEEFMPEIKLETGLKELVHQGKDVLATFISNLKNWSEEELEIYNCPHPVFGKMTVREILYFTIYHAHHHTETINKMNEK